MLDQAHAKRAAAAAPSNPSRSTQHAVLCALMTAASSNLSPVKAPARSNQGKGHSQYATLGVWQRSLPAAAGPPMAPCLAGCAQQQETGMAAVTSVTRRCCAHIRRWIWRAAYVGSGHFGSIGVVS